MFLTKTHAYHEISYHSRQIKIRVSVAFNRDTNLQICAYFGPKRPKNNLSKSTSFITHKYINNTTIFNEPSECICHNYIYPRLFGTRLIGTRPTETRLIGTLKINRVQLERVSLARNRLRLHNHKTNIAPGRATILESKLANKVVYGVASMTC